MTEAERIWSETSDDDLLEAAAGLATYTDEGQRVIREELRRRGLEDPVEQARFAAPDPNEAHGAGGHPCMNSWIRWLSPNCFRICAQV